MLIWIINAFWKHDFGTDIKAGTVTSYSSIP